MTKRLHARSFRQTDAEWEETKAAASLLGVSPSDMVRGAVSLCIEAAKSDPTANPLADLIRQKLRPEPSRKKTDENGHGRPVARMRAA